MTVLLAAVLATAWALRPEGTAPTGMEQKTAAGMERERRGSVPVVASLGIDPGSAAGTGAATAPEPRPQADRIAAPAGDAPPVAQPAAEPMAPLAVAPARLRFVAHPWAEVAVDDDPPFLTPRALPVELTPGPHRVVFTHPTYGREVVSLDVKPGEEKVVSHVFEEADGR